MDQDWTFAAVWEAVAAARPDAVAQIHHGRRYLWREFEARAEGVAAALTGAGLSRQDKVALYLHNGPEYLEGAFAAMKASLVPVNINYRYRRDELLYLWRNADVAAVIFHGTFTETIEELRPSCPQVLAWLHVEDGTGLCPSWARAYEDCATARPAPERLPRDRSGDDLILIYTGGTTGLPRGVMWRQHDLYLASNTTQDPPTADLADVRARIAAAESRPVGLPAAPLMHGTGYVFASTILNRGGAIVTLAGRQFDPVELLDAIATEQVSDLCIVGDAFCRPIVECLDSEPGRWDLSSLKVVSSSGMMWSPEVKQRLLAHAPEALLIDFLNSSEASGLGRSLTSSRRAEKGARFQLGRNAFVIDDAGETVAPGSGVVGRLAVRGLIPLGYYKDPEKTAATFPTIDGIRCAVPGDYATVESDGSITLLGRGSVSINTGGEKVFPEEVEEAIKTFPDVRDAVVVGLPDARFGQVVAAAVETAEGRSIDGPALIAHVRGRLARHKAPRHVVTVSNIGRGPNGKADYPDIRRRIIERLAETAQPAETN